jgi:hypothetical protein
MLLSQRKGIPHLNISSPDKERERHRDMSYRNIAMGFDMIHPKTCDSPSFAQEFLDSFQSKRTQKTINSERIGQRFL